MIALNGGMPRWRGHAHFILFYANEENYVVVNILHRCFEMLLHLNSFPSILSKIQIQNSGTI